MTTFLPGVFLCLSHSDSWTFQHLSSSFFFSKFVRQLPTTECLCFLSSYFNVAPARVGTSTTHGRSHSKANDETHTHRLSAPHSLSSQWRTRTSSRLSMIAWTGTSGNFWFRFIVPSLMTNPLWSISSRGWSMFMAIVIAELLMQYVLKIVQDPEFAFLRICTVFSGIYAIFLFFRAFAQNYYVYYAHYLRICSNIVLVDVFARLLKFVFPNNCAFAQNFHYTRFACLLKFCYFCCVLLVQCKCFLSCTHRWQSIFSTQCPAPQHRFSSQRLCVQGSGL